MTDDEFDTVDEKISYVKDRITPKDLCEQFEIEIDHDKIASPWNPDERTASCHLYEDHFFDYSTGKGGDIIDLAVALTGKTWAAALNMLAKGAQAGDLEPTVRRTGRPVEVPNLMPRWAEVVAQCSASEAEPWTLDGVSSEALVSLYARRLLRNDRENLYIPHQWEGKVHGIKIRDRFGRKTAVPGSQFGAHLYWAYMAVPLVIPTPMTIVITEGESDAWALLDKFGPGVSIAALPSGAGTWRSEWLIELADYGTVVTAFDNDAAGKAATDKVALAVGYGRHRTLIVPQLFNDVREAVIGGWTPSLK